MRIILSIIVCGLCTCINGIELDEILENTVKNYEGMTSFYAEFEQVVCDEVAGTCDRYEGRIFFVEPGFFRMEIDDPQRVYVGDSVSLWIYLPGENRAIKQEMTGMPFHINPDMLLADYDEQYHVRLSDTTEGTYEVTLIPKDETTLYQDMVISISRRSFRIGAITIRDEIGSENKYTFRTFDANRRISKDMFNFKPPAGTQIDEY